MADTGLFLTVEGVEGSGKTTQLHRLASLVQRGPREVVLTREPGGTPLSDRIRALLLDPDEKAMDPITELLLYAAARRQHVVQLIEPALGRGAVVLCDRFTDATLAYQGYGRTLSLDRLQQLNSMATGGLRPGLTILYDLPEEEGLRRAHSRNLSSAQSLGESRMEGEDLRFHRRVREGYLALAAAEPERFIVIDSSGAIDEITATTLQRLTERLPAFFPSIPPAS